MKLTTLMKATMNYLKRAAVLLIAQLLLSQTVTANERSRAESALSSGPRVRISLRYLRAGRKIVSGIESRKEQLCPDFSFRCLG